VSDRRPVASKVEDAAERAFDAMMQQGYFQPEEFFKAGARWLLEEARKECQRMEHLPGQCDINHGAKLLVDYLKALFEEKRDEL